MMTLAQFLRLNSRFTIPYLQDAYAYTANKIRLNPVALPARLNKSCRINGFDNPAYLLNGGVLAIKELSSIDGVDLETDFNSAYSALPLTIGNEDAPGFGFDDFSELNNAHDTKPIIHWLGTDIICTNLDAAFFWITAYAYPFFVTHGDPYENGNAHSYSIQAMVDRYGPENLTVDPVLAYPVGLRALAISHQDYGNLANAATLDGVVNTVINLYNNNPELFRSNFILGSNNADAGSL